MCLLSSERSVWIREKERNLNIMDACSCVVVFHACLPAFVEYHVGVFEFGQIRSFCRRKLSRKEECPCDQEFYVTSCC